MMFEAKDHPVMQKESVKLHSLVVLWFQTLFILTKKKKRLWHDFVLKNKVLYINKVIIIIIIIKYYASM